jgi:betaine-aldehyde dehydrogenase
MGRFPKAEADAEAAVAAARAAFDAWSATPPPSAPPICKIADNLKARSEELAQ